MKKWLSRLGSMAMCVVLLLGSAPAQALAEAVESNTFHLHVETPQEPEATDPVVEQGAEAHLTCAEDGPAKTLTLSADYAGSGTLSWSVSSAANLGTAMVSDAGLVSYTPDADQNGEDTFTVTVSDGAGSDSIVISVTVTAVNDAPFLPVCADVQVTEDCGAQVLPNWAGATPGPANENDQVLTYYLSGGAAGLFTTGGEPAVAADGTLTFTPAENVSGEAAFTLYATDDAGGSNTSLTRNFTITVLAANDAPVNTALPEAQGSLTAGSTLTATQGTWNDDADGNLGTLTYGIRWQSATNGDGEGLSDLGTGDTFTLTDAQRHRYMRVLVTVTDTDAAGTVTAEAASVWALVGNEAPVIAENEAALQLEEDNAGTLTLHASDGDSDALTWSATQPAKGSATVADGVITYTPNADENGDDSFTVTVSDGMGGMDSLPVNVTLVPVNDAPAFTVGSDVTVTEDCGAQTLTGWISALSKGAVNESDQTLAFTVTDSTNPDLFAADGSPAVSPDGTLSFTPAQDGHGTATLTLMAQDSGDGTNTSAPQTFTITVTASNDAPINLTLPTVTGVQKVGNELSAAPGTWSDDADSNDGAYDYTYAWQSAADENGADLQTLGEGESYTLTAGDSHRYVRVLVTLGDTNESGTATVQAASVWLPVENTAPVITEAEALLTVTEDTANFITLHATDADGDSLIWSAGSSVIGTVTLTDGTFTYTPDPDACGSDAFTATVSDGHGGTASLPVSVTLLSVNDTPTFTLGDSQTVAEDGGPQTVPGWLRAASAGPADEAAQTLEVTIVDNSRPSLFTADGQPALAPDGTLSYTPAPDQNGVATLSVQACDSGGGEDTSATQIFTITVTPINDVPSFTVGEDQTVAEDSGAVTVAGWATGLSAGPTDEAGQALTFHVTNDNAALFSTAGQPAVAPNGTLTFTPAINANGDATVTLYVTDNGGTANPGDVAASAAQTFTVRVTPVNDPPTFTDGPDQTVDEDCGPQTVPGWVSGQSAGPDNEAAQTLSYHVQSNSNPALFTEDGAPAVSPEGTLTYTPALNMNGSASITLYVKDSGDGNNTSAARVFLITVNAVNDAPVVTGEASATTPEDTALAYHFTLADAEQTAGSLTIALGTNNTALVKNTSMALSGTGADRVLTVTPEPNRSGSVTLTITVTDSVGAATVKTVALTVTPVNDAPTISTIAKRVTDEDTSTGPIGFTIGDVDTDPATCTVSAISDNEALVPNTAANIAVGGSGASRTVTLTPAPDQSGTANITVTVSDGDLSSATSFQLTVNAVPDAPTITPIADVTINEDSVTSPIAFTLADVDSPLSDLTVTAATGNTAMIPRANISLAPIAEDGSCAITLSPVADQYGTATLYVTVSDASKKLSTATFRLIVLPVNDAPVLSAIGPQTVNEDGARTLTLNVSDIDNTDSQLTLTATASTQTALLPLSAITVTTNAEGTRTVTLRPLANQNGIVDVTLTLADGAGGIAKRTFSLTVNAVNDKPTFTPGANVTVEEDCGAYSKTGWASGITTGAPNEDQQLTFTLETDNNAMFAVLPAIDSGTGTLTFTPALNACGVVNLTATLTDSEGESSAAAAFTITIQPINDAPVAQDLTTGLNTDEDQQLSGGLRATDVDANPLTFELVDDGGLGVTSLDTPHGQVTLNAAAGTFLYIPALDFYDGTDTFQYRAYDGELYSNTATVTIDFTGVNDAPVARDGELTLLEDQTLDTGSLSSWITDVDNTTLAYSIVTGPDAGGSLTLDEATGSFSYTPAANYDKSERFTFRAFDGKLYSNTATCTVTLTPVNDAPVPIDGNVSVDQGQTLSGLFKATDVEQDAITYALETDPAPEGFTLIDGATGQFSYTPPSQPTVALRTVTVLFTATDANGAASTGTIVITVRGVNLPPVRVAGSPAVFTATEDVLLSGNLGISDPNGDTLTYTLWSHPSNGTLSEFASDGSFTYLSNTNYSGTDRFTFMATDAKGLCSGIYTAQITVVDANDDPEVYDQYYYTNMNVPVTNIVPVGFDVDGNSLTYSIESQPGNGVATPNGDGTFTYTPKTDYVGTDTFTYTASDRFGGKSKTATIHIYVYGTGGTGENRWFNAIDNQTTPENIAKTVPFSVLRMTIAQVTATSSNHWLLDNSDIQVAFGDTDGTLVLTPNLYRTGRSVITVTVTDTSGYVYIRTFIFTVTRVNFAPTANSLERTIDENSEMFEFVTGHDYNGDALTFALATQPANGTLTFNADGTFHYVPNHNFYGTDSFTFTVADAESVSTAGTVAITVTQVPLAPIANDGSFATDEDTPYAGSLTGTEPNGGALKYYLVQDAHLGKVTVASNGSFAYTPDADVSGADAFTFRIEGPSQLFSSVAHISITVNPVNDLPVMAEKRFTAYEDQPVSGYLEASDVDKGDTLTYELVTQEGDLALGTLTLDGSTGRFTYTPYGDMNGTDSFHVRVKDAVSQSEPVLLRVVIQPMNDAPVAQNVTIEVDEDAAITSDVTPFYRDVDGDAQVFSAVQSPAMGTIAFDTDGTYTYTPTANKNGTDYFTFRTRDSGGLSSNVALAKVVIRPVNDAPVLTLGDAWAIPEDSQNRAFYFTVADVEDSASALKVSGTWDHSQIDTVTFWGTGSSRWMLVTPVDSYQGKADITVTLTDTGNDGTLSGDVKTDTRTVTVTVTSVNDTPTINTNRTDGIAITSAVTINEDTHTEALPFTVNDEESGPDGLLITGASDNASLVPAGGISFGGSGANRTLTVTPAPDKFGKTRVTISVSDHNTTRTAYVDVTVLPVNDAPVVKPPADQTIPEDGRTPILYYTISDIDSVITNIVMTGSSSDTSIVADSGITLSGNGSERTVAVSAAPDANGDVTLTLTADDSGLVNRYGSATFVVHVTPVDDAPAVEPIANYEIPEDSATDRIPVLLSDIDDDAANLTLSVVSGNPALVDASDIAFGTGTSDGERWMTLTPKPNQNGAALITVKATDPSGRSTQRSFTLTVTPVNDPPTITAVPDQTILEDQSTKTLTFTVADIDNDVLTLTVTGASGDTATIPNSGIVIVGNGAERTVKVTPAANQNGDIPVTLTVTDAGPGPLSADTTFTVHITPVNDQPAFTPGANVTTDEDSGTQTLPAWATGITAGKPNEETQALTFVASNNNSTLFTTDGQPAVDSSGQLTYTPAANMNGVATVTLYLMDDAGTQNGGVDTSESCTFTITVRPVNDQPTFEDSGNVTVVEDSPAYSAAWAKAGTVYVGPSNETQTHTFALLSTTVISLKGNTSLFSAGPAINAQTGALTFTPTANANGVAELTVVLRDDDGTANGGLDTSVTHTFTITVTPVDDNPTFTLPATVTVNEDSLPYSQKVVTGITPGGGTDESGQTLTFTLSGYTTGLFAVQPAISSSGTLTFTPAVDMNGTTTLTVNLSDGTNTVTHTFKITIRAVNDKPAFTKGADQQVNEDCKAQTVANWATGLVKGPADEELIQTLTFTVTNNNNALFAVQPTVSSEGHLSYTPADDAFGVATVTVVLKDDGGTSNNGQNASAAQTFTITVLPVNDQPSFSDAGDVTVNEDSSPYSAAWAKSGTIRLGPANEAQTYSFALTDTAIQSVAGNTELFTVLPAIDPQTGALSFMPAPNASGVAKLTVLLTDTDGTLRGGVDTSVPHTLTLTITAVNDAPTFTPGDPVTVLEDSGAYDAAFATGITPGGGTDESGQSLAFTLSGYDAALFASAPALSSTGRLTFRPAADAFGVTTVTATLSDGGTTTAYPFQITIEPVNDAPSFTDSGDVTVNEDSGAYKAAWAKAASISAGPVNENQTHAFRLQSMTVQSVAGNTTLFSTDPAIDAQTGELTFTPAPNANGVAELSVVLTDTQGVTNGGMDTSSVHTFTLTVRPVNDQPTFEDSGDITVAEDSGAYEAAWAKAGTFYVGPADEQQTRTFAITDTQTLSLAGNSRLFNTAPTIDPQTGAVAFTPEDNASGVAEVTVVLRDEDGTANGGLDTSAAHTLMITVGAENDNPIFTPGETVTVREDSGAYAQAWASGIGPGGGTDEATQPLTFTLTGYTASLFSVAPALASNGRLTFTPANDQYGVTDITVTLSDGVDSVTETLRIEVLPVNDQPTFEKGGDQQVNEDAGAQSINGWATNMNNGPDNESAQTLAFTVDSDNASLFTAAGQPSLDANGCLTYTPAPNAYGQAHVSVTLVDNGGTDNGGTDTSETAACLITVLPVNDQPSFTDSGDITVAEDSGVYDAAWAKPESQYLGPDNEQQAYAYSLDSVSVTSLAGNTSLFSAGPTVNADTGAVSFTPASNANGAATLTVTLRDDDGTQNGGVDTSVIHTFTLTVTPVNDDPTFETAGTVTVLEDSGVYGGDYATGITPGGGTDEAAQTLNFTLSGYDAALFTVAPALTSGGRLSFTTAADAFGDAEVQAALSDGEKSVTLPFTLSILPVNDQPSFTDSGNITVDEDSGTYHQPWADPASISAGPANEIQAHAFVLQSVTVQSVAGNTSLFSTNPAIDPQTGAVSFTPATNANGVAEVTVVLTDDGGTKNGGVDTSAVHIFTITVNAVDDAPTFAPGAPVTVNEDSGLYDQPFATGITPGGGTDESGQTLTFTLDSYSASLFAVAPTITPAGRLQFRPASDANGSTNLTVTLSDGVNTVTASFQITVRPINDPPTFNPGGDQQVLQNSGAQSVPGWATGLYRGPGNESGQSLTFTVTNSNNALFATGGQPAVSGNGQLTYTPATNAYGTATVSVMLTDNGGTDNGGDNSSATSTFTITVLPGNTQMTTALTVTAVWADRDNKDGIRPASVTVYLYNDVGAIRKQVLDASNGWAFTFTDLPMFNQNGVPIVYRVVETAEVGYRATYAYGAEAVTITNTHNPDPFEASSIGILSLLDLPDYDIPLGANSNMNEGDCFN